MSIAFLRKPARDAELPMSSCALVVSSSAPPSLVSLAEQGTWGAVMDMLRTDKGDINAGVPVSVSPRTKT